MLTACASTQPKHLARTEYPYWKKGADAAEAAAFLRVRVPEGATEVRGAVRVQPQEHVYLLSFVTDSKTAEAVVDDLRPDHPLKTDGAPSSLSGDGFEHLGLTSPQDVKGVRTASACPPCVGDSRRGHVQGIEAHVDDMAGGRARVYLTAY
ncbi:hypothetical protein HGA06_00370 [Streptomyces somaliensis DSM 40738]|uniref:Uncharacterized protein n=1 Tax=Streptomyces somaliensis (strain ATCC 33201 / DSM 40738 / JCM 12659 / KCTC 9044 / NCTC 11332 / NRRL B-12077 / IP 733) TaxID=1134445 RepID=A0AA44DA85_STRE0|nr:hypothetical protein [Streptomyces somaliensis DSM 40738]